MTNWDINTTQAAGVLGRAGTQASGYEGEITSVSNALSGATTSLTNSPLVLSRLGEFKEQEIDTGLTKVTGHTHSALQGTSDAIGYYVAGDLEMAARAQRNASSATYPTPPGTGGGGGGRQGQQVPQ